MRGKCTFLLSALAAAVLPGSPCCAAGPGLTCQGVEKNDQLTLKVVPLGENFEKIVLTGPANFNDEYLIEGVRKIPVGEDRALVGSRLTSTSSNKQGEISLDRDSYFEMYRPRGTSNTSRSENAVFVFDHQLSAVETLDLKTGKRVQNEQRPQGRISLHCEHFPEYLQHAVQSDSAAMVWSRSSERRAQELADRFATAYIDEDLVFDNAFLGVEIWQNPFDMWVFQQMISELKPDLIIETGTAHGGSALFFATMLGNVHPVGRVITVEIDPDVDSNIREARRFPVFGEKVQLIKGDSVSDETLAHIQALIEKARSRHDELTVLVTLDSLHSAEHVLNELRLYAPLVSKGSYIVVQDTIIDRDPKFFDWFVRPWAQEAKGGPALAVEEFLAENSEFEQDNRWEKYYLSFYPGGFLKKTK